MKYIFICIIYFITQSSSVQAQNSDSRKKNNVKNTVSYSLPKTILTVNVSIKKTEYHKGIYASYAEKYLGIKNVPETDSCFYQIMSAELLSDTEPDPGQSFSYTAKNNQELEQIISFNHRGIIIGTPDRMVKSVDLNFHNLQNTICDPLLVDDKIVSKTDTLYKTVLTDTSLVKIPVFRKQIIAKNEEELAKETAHELLKTRKRKLKLIRGEYDFHPDAATLQYMVTELNKQEQDFLQLFTGYRFESVQPYTFIISNLNIQTQNELFSFNSTTGINPANGTAQKVYLNYFTESPIKSTDNPGETNGINFLRYKIPVYTTVQLLIDSKSIHQFRIPVYQFGETNFFNPSIK